MRSPNGPQARLVTLAAKRTAIPLIYTSRDRRTVRHFTFGADKDYFRRTRSVSFLTTAWNSRRASASPCGVFGPGPFT